jgi:uncharacterized protein
MTTKTRVVLDTNIIMDMLHFGDARTRVLQAALVDGRLAAYTDAGCLAELERVTGYPEFGLSDDGRAALIACYLGVVARCDDDGEECYPLPRCRDPDDQKFLILSARCKAACLITRDKQLLRLDRHRHRPPPFAILTAEAACVLLQLAPEHPAPGF